MNGSQRLAAARRWTRQAMHRGQPRLHETARPFLGLVAGRSKIRPGCASAHGAAVDVKPKTPTTTTLGRSSSLLCSDACFATPPRQCVWVAARRRKCVRPTASPLMQRPERDGLLAVPCASDSRPKLEPHRLLHTNRVQPFPMLRCLKGHSGAPS